MTDAPTIPTPARQLWLETPWPERLTLGTVLAISAATSWYLLPFWREQPELSHGYFALPCSLALLWQSRREPNLADSWSRGTAWALRWTLFLAGALLGSIATLAALAQGPLHSQTAFLGGIAASLFLLSGLIALARSPTQRVSCNGAGLAAVALWCFVVPLPSGTLSRFTLFLQDMITAGSLQALHLLGFPAIRHGNVIQLANTLVGVEEACSGIRSLTACLFAGVVLGGFMLQGLRARVAIVLGAGLIAIASNFFRSTALCVFAARGVEINGFWHDATAYAVLGLTAVVLFVGCLVLGPKHPVGGATESRSRAALIRQTFTAHATLVVVFALLMGILIVKIVPAPADEGPPPDLGALLVMEAPGWQRRTDESIFAFSKALNTSHLRQESYFRPDGTQLTFYVAYWPSDQSTLGSVALHTPDICLPGSGWTTRPLPPEIERYPLPHPRRFAFDQEAYPQYVWFWHYFNGQPVRESSGLYPWQLGPALLKRGISPKAPQWVIRISSNRPLEQLRHEPIIQEFVGRLQAAALSPGDAGD